MDYECVTLPVLLTKISTVKQPGVPVRTLMIVVAMIAIDLALIRVVFANAMAFGLGLQALIDTIPMGLMLNYCVLRVVDTGGRPGTFWLGFAVCGTAAMLSMAWAALTPAGSVLSTNGAPNQILEGSKIWALWECYFEFAMKCLKSVGLDTTALAPRSLDRPGIGYVALTGVVSLIPQLLIALVGGLIGYTSVSKRELDPAAALAVGEEPVDDESAG